MKRLRRWLHNRASQPRQNFALLINGFFIFAAGVAIILYAQYGLHDSLSAEFAALGGIIVAAAGILLATFAYLCLSVLRIFTFLDSDDDDEDSPPRH